MWWVGMVVLACCSCGEDHIFTKDEGESTSPAQIVTRPGEDVGRVGGEDPSSMGAGEQGEPSTSSGSGTSGSGAGSSSSGSSGTSGSGSGWGSSGGVDPGLRGETSGGNGEVYPAEEMHLSMLRGCGEDGRWRTQFFLTGTPGRLSCLAIEDTDVIPAGAGFQYWVMLGEALGGEPQLPEQGCPVGEYLIEPSALCQFMLIDDVPLRTSDFDRCAVYRQWDEGGLFDREEPVARSGLIQIEQVEEGCVIDVELHFRDRTSLNGTYLIEDVSQATSCSSSF